MPKFCSSPCDVRYKSVEELLVEMGLPALFLLSFLAATVIPLGSEWLLVALVAKAAKLEYAVAVATAGNYLGACTTYLIGLWGAVFFIERVLRIDEKTFNRAKSFYDRYGFWTLLFSWLPIIGDPLCLVGGVLRLNFFVFSVFVLTGKLVRYAAVAAVTAAAM